MYDEVALKRFYLYLRAAWSRETSADPKNWTLENPAWGQCAVSALALEHFFEGEILRLDIPRDFDPKKAALGSHYLNRVDGQIIDISTEQFTDEEYQRLIAGIRLATVLTKEELLSNPDTHRRFHLLFAEMVRITSDEIVKN